MSYLVHIFAPVGLLGWISRWYLLLMAINVVNIGVEYGLNNALEKTIAAHVVTTTLVATPFIILFLALISHLDKLQRQLTHIATTDMLTGLPNRRAFFERAARAGQDDDGVILMLDVDHFKKVNDVHGHAIGDLCLKAVAHRIGELVQPGDVVGRLGGEEFGIYLVGAPVEVARNIGERLAKGIHLPTGDPAQDISVTISVGAVPSRVATTLAQLLVHADEALYAAKLAGRSRLVLWNSATHSAA